MEMKKFINHFWAVGGVKEFNTETGQISKSSEFDWMKAPDWGSAWKQNGKWFIFHNDDTSLILQHKRNIWRINKENEIKLRHFFIIRNFKITKNGNTVFSIWYKPKYLFFWYIDPTYDSIDAESDDFFLYVKAMWNYWRNKPYTDFIKHINELKLSSKD